jgi:hypothetical protein
MLYLAAEPEVAPHRAALAAAADAARTARPELSAEIDACAGLALSGAGYQAMRRCTKLGTAQPAG